MKTREGTDPQTSKARVRAYWDERTCGTAITGSRRFSRAYFDEIEAHRYAVEPEIFSFAQFTRFHGQRVLEIGVGAGTDFIQWVRAGARAYGVDLTEEAVRHVRERLRVYGLEAEDVRVADAEALPYPDEMFDLVYAWGVLHHTPDPVKALSEMIRVTRMGGLMKFMVYNRRSLNVFYKYLYYALLRGKPFKSFAWVLYHHQESIGTRGYTAREIRDILSEFPVELCSVDARVTRYDLVPDRAAPLRVGAYLLSALLGVQRVGYFLRVEARKTSALPSRGA